jgi:hypothetical protein
MGNNLKGKFGKMVFVMFVLVISCKNQDKANFQSFGNEISSEGVLTSNNILATYTDLAIGDTIDVKFKAAINAVCKSKGCWMRLALNDSTETMVKFKDYGFFMPLDAAGDVIVNGKAFVNYTSIDELKHYAEDAGKSKAEIEAITEPKAEYSFIADGVLLAKK